MTRKLISAGELLALIQAEVSNSNDLDGDCQECKLNGIQWHEPDMLGSNWDLHSFRGPTACSGFVVAIVERFKRTYNLVGPK